ncbi:MAG: hypothetical protein ACTSVM_05650 [Candidatus Ranarchaeia archaeon]
MICSRCLTIRHEKLIVCSNCHSADLTEYYETTDSGFRRKSYRCNQCNGTGIVEAARQVRQCPKCLSEEVIDTPKKLKVLTKTHKDAIRRLLSPDHVLQKVSSRFSELRERLFKLRNIFLHYPSIETNMLRVHQSLPRIQDKILAEVHNIVQQFRSMTQNLPNFSQVPPRLIRVYNESIEQLTVEAAKIERYCHDLLAPVTAGLNAVQQQIQELERWESDFSRYEKRIPFASDELFVAILPHVRVLGADFESGVRHNGTLIFTNRRLILFGEKGLFRKHLDKLVEYYLPSKGHVREQGRFSRHLTLAVKPGHIRVTTKTGELNELARLYNLAVDFDNLRLQDLHLSRQIAQLRVDLGDFKYKLQGYIKSAVTRSTHNPLAPSIRVSPQSDMYNYTKSTVKTEQPNYSPAEIPSFLFDGPSVQTQQTTNESGSGLTSTTVPNLDYLFDQTQSYRPNIETSCPASESNNGQNTSPNILRLQGERHSINATIHWLKEQWDRAKISQQDYLQQYRELMRQLYIVETNLRDPQLKTDFSQAPTYL